MYPAARRGGVGVEWRGSEFTFCSGQKNGEIFRRGAFVIYRDGMTWGGSREIIEISTSHYSE